jgi:hypothetical protein
MSGGAPGCPVSHQRPRSALGDELVALGNSPMAPRLKFTRLSGEPTMPATNSRQRDQRATRGPSQRSLGRTGLSDVHQTVSIARRGQKVQQPASPEKKGDRAPDKDCSCPMRHPIEGKNFLPNGTPTAPSCLGAIKGTPRRMEHYTKHPLNILRRLDSATTQSDHRV